MTKTPNFPELNYKSDEDPLSYFSKVKNKAVYSAIICYLGPVLGYKFCGVPLSAAAGFKAHSKYHRNLRGDRNLTPKVNL